MSGPHQGLGRSLLRSVPGWIAAVVAGFAADLAGIPLAWVLAPLVAAAAFSIGGLPPIAPVETRRAGQLVVGTAIGLYMTAEAAQQLPGWLPIMIASAVVSIALSGVLSGLLARVGRVDRATAYFAILPGGLSEMANVGATFGARIEAVSLSHAIRVALAVLLVPALVIAIDPVGSSAPVARPAVLPIIPIALLGLCALAGAGALHLVRLANPWFLGALGASGLVASLGLVEGRLPDPLLWLGQLLIGMSIGIRFKREVVRSLPLFGLASLGASILLGALLVGYAILLQRMSDAGLTSLVLAVSPGGFAEMSLTAKALSLNIALVTGFHFVRAFVVNSVSAFMWRRVFAVEARPPD